MIAKLIMGILACACLFLALELERMRPYWPLSRTITPPLTRAGITHANTDEEILQVVIPAFAVDKMPLENVLAILTDKTSVNIVGEWIMLRWYNVERNTPVTLHLHNATLRQTLDALIGNLQTPLGKPGYYVADGFVILSNTAPSRTLGSKVTTEMIDIRPLVRELQAPRLPLYPPNYDTLDERLRREVNHEKLTPNVRHLSYGEIIDAVKEVIVRTIDPESWGGNRGDLRRIDDVAGVLVVTATPEDIHRVRSLLDALHRTAVAGNSPPAATPGASKGATPAATSPVQTQDSIGAITECFNIRPLLGKVDPQSKSPHPLMGELYDIPQIVTQFVAWDSWDRDDKPGKIVQLGWMNIVTQTPENMRRVRRFYAAFDKAAGAAHFPSPGHLPSPGFARADRIVYPNDLYNGMDIEFINIRPMVERMRSLSPLRHRALVDSWWVASGLEGLIGENINPDLWMVYGSGDGLFRAMRDVLVMTNTPAVLDKVHRLVDCLDRATFATHFAPSDGPNSTTPPETMQSESNLAANHDLVMAFINVSALTRLWSDHLPKENGDFDRFLELRLEQIANWKSPHENGDSIRRFPGVLVVISTPQQIQQMQKQLESDYLKMLHGEFPPLPRIPDPPKISF